MNALTRWNQLKELEALRQAYGDRVLAYEHAFVQAGQSVPLA